MPDTTQGRDTTSDPVPALFGCEDIHIRLGGRPILEGVTVGIRPGEVLGVSAVMLDKPYEFSAETLEPCQVNFIRRDQFLRFLAAHPDAAMRLAMQLSDNCLAAHHDIRARGWGRTVTLRASVRSTGCSMRSPNI